MDPTLEAKLHPESLKALECLQSLGLPPYHECGSVQEAREGSLARAQALGGTFNFNGITKVLLIPGPPSHKSGILVNVYQPHSLCPDPTIFVYFHGGGLVLGSRHTVDTACKMIASHGNLIVVNVEYRLCPNHKFPAMMDDGEFVTNWILANKELLGGTSKSLVGIGGDSGGGHIASSVCHRVTGISFQILVYPYVSHQHFPSYDENLAGPGLSMALIDWLRSMWAETPEDFNNLRLTPLLYDKFDHLPPALFIVAGADPLKDHSYAYQEKMNQAGVHTELFLLPGILHSFFHYPGVYKESCHKAYDKITDFISRITA